MSAVRSALGLHSFRVALGLSSALGVALLSIPLFAVQGVESALVLGIVLPPLSGLVGARLAIRARTDASTDALTLCSRAVVAGMLLLLPPASILAFNALRVPNCAPLEGLAFLLLGPVMSIVLASIAGACAGALPIPAGIASVVGIGLALADMGRALYDLYATPGVFAYGHFFGYFPGSLYDELVTIPGPLVTLRAVTLALVVALVSGLYALYPRGARPSRRTLRRAVALSVVSTSAALVGVARAESLGHRTSVGFIRSQLGAAEWSRRCELIVPREMRKQRRARLASDCDFRVAQLERFFGLREERHVRVFVFRSADEKRELMGAAHTNIAKPWRHEIYLQDDAFPHPVMAHELAHIIAGHAGIGPMRIAGRLHGLFPDFALIEGAAVAAAWGSSATSGMTPHQWSRAMIELGIAPSLESMFGSGFLRQQHRLAYMFTGSLLRYIADTHGSAMLRRIYRSDDLPRELGMSLGELEQKFRAFLMTVELPESARALAKQRFSGSSILSSVCPHAKAQLRAELEGALLADDAEEAMRTCERLLRIDPQESTVRAALVGILARRGQLEAAERELTLLQGPDGAKAPLVANAMQALADEAFRNHDLGLAQRIYRTLLTYPSDRDSLRQLQVRNLAFEGSARQRELLFSLLIGEPGLAADAAYAVYLSRELRAERDDGLPYYLEARQLYGREHFEEARVLLDEAARRGLPSSELAVEAGRLRATSAFVAGDLGEAERVWTDLLATPEQLGIQAEAQDFLARIGAKRGAHQAQTQR